MQDDFWVRLYTGQREYAIREYLWCRKHRSAINLADMRRRCLYTIKCYKEIMHNAGKS